MRLVHDEEGSFVSRLGFLELRKALCEKLEKTEEVQALNKEIERLKNVEREQQDIANKVMDFIFQQRFDDARRLLLNIKDQKRIDTLRGVIEESCKDFGRLAVIRSREDDDLEEKDKPRRKSRKTAEESGERLSDARRNRFLSEARLLLSRGSISDARHYLGRLSGDSRAVLREQIEHVESSTREVAQDRLLREAQLLVARGNISGARDYAQRLFGERKNTLRTQLEEVGRVDSERCDDRLVEEAFEALDRRDFSCVQECINRIHAADKKQLVRDALTEMRS